MLLTFFPCSSTGTFPQTTGLLKLLQPGSFLQTAVQRAGPAHRKVLQKRLLQQGYPKGHSSFQKTCVASPRAPVSFSGHLLWHRVFHWGAAKVPALVQFSKGYRSFPLHCGKLTVSFHSLHRLMQAHLCSSTWRTSSPSSPSLTVVFLERF